MKWFVLALLLTVLSSGCVTQGTDWQARIGHYTLQQAITDMGPPVKSEELSDGSVVKEWLTERSHVIVAPEPYFVGRNAYVGPDTPNYSETDVPDYYLRLTFAPDGKLKAWKRFAK